MLPIWRPDVAADAVLRDAIIGHVSVQTDEPAPVELTSNTLVFFAGRDAETPLSWLGEALKQRQRRGLSLVCCVVLPDGTFAMRRRELEARLGSFDERLGAELHLTEDTEGGWSRTFAPSALPAVFLLDARRRFVWKHEGALTPRELADAIDRRAEVAPPPRNVPLRLAVAPGDRMLDASFQDGQGEPQALHRLRGRRTILNFWQPWSAPCRRELERLRDLHESGKDRPLVIAFQGGAKTDLDRARKELGLPYLVVHDVDHAVARAYRVRCWPTTIAFDAGGRVEHVQFGATSSR
jgi:peroxiredoxin